MLYSTLQSMMWPHCWYGLRRWRHVLFLLFVFVFDRGGDETIGRLAVLRTGFLDC